jgi:hypothetical protein
MPSPAVSIVITNFNYERFLRQCVESALAQTYPGTEVVVVDDASTDGSRDLIRSFGARVVPILQEANGGQAAAFNAGFAAARGDLIIFLDADDFLYPQAAEQVARAWRPGVGTVQYRLHLVDKVGNRIDLYPSAEVRFDRGDVVHKLLATGRYEGTVTSGNAFARGALEAVLPVPPGPFRIGADGYLVTTVPFYGAIEAIDEPLGAYRQHGANLWLVAPSLVLGFRRSILHDADKHRVLAERAAALGFPQPAPPGRRDYMQVGVRIGSLLLEPDQHPVTSDTCAGLAVDGVRAALRAPLPWSRRAIVALWFLWVGLLPRSLARPALTWRYEPSSRPPAIARLLRLLRRATTCDRAPGGRLNHIP